eukprot:TRINITY_DN17153_c0_g1_i2.p1 TRINITY_DN17153_c0_g1~~TRINITY_DN17153_c0_g1_i2.p1  ORF type:complete len:519 (-),score=76.88 TRINITY_DN17153_c0_g1_i2:481-1992(-)
MLNAFNVFGSACAYDTEDEDDVGHLPDLVEVESVAGLAQPPLTGLFVTDSAHTFVSAAPIDSPALETSASHLHDLGPSPSRLNELQALVDEGELGLTLSDSKPAAKGFVTRQCLEPGVTLVPLLKATAPKPVGVIPGRFQVRLVRSHLGQPLGISFHREQKTGAVVVPADLPHLGIYKGDEIIRVNNMVPESLYYLQAFLRKALVVEITWQQCKEFEKKQVQTGMPWMWTGTAIGSGVEASEVFSECLHPPASQMAAKDWPELDLLSCSPPLPVPDGPDDHRVVYISRTSLHQSFFLKFCSEHRDDFSLAAASTSLSHEVTDEQAYPHASSQGGCHKTLGLATMSRAGSEAIFSREASAKSLGETQLEFAELRHALAVIHAAIEFPPRETLIVLDALPQYGLQRNDELVAINGERLLSAEHCHALLKTSMLIKLEFKTNAKLAELSILQPVELVVEEEPTDSQERRCDDGGFLAGMLNLNLACTVSQETPQPLMSRTSSLSSI